MLLTFIFAQSFPASATDEERFENAIRSVGNRGVSCFISHAWGPEDDFVDRLNGHLRNANIRTYYDRTDVPLGGDIMQFIQQHLTNQENYVIAVYTPTYKRKAESEENSGVKIEWRYISSRLLGNKKFIPILFGDESVSVPSIASYINYLSFTNANYYEQFFKILGHILPVDAVTELNQLRYSLIPQRRPVPNAMVVRPIERPLGPAIPEIARGYEEIYRRFINGKLIYKPNQDNDVGRIEIPFMSLKPSPLEGTFDLSRCGDVGKYISIATGYRKGQKWANANTVEVWIVPKFVVERDLSTTARHLAPIMGSFTSPVGLFWTWGRWDDSSEQLGWYDYLTVQNFDDLSNGEDLYEKYKKSRSLWTLYSMRREGWILAPQSFGPWVGNTALALSSVLIKM